MMLGHALLAFAVVAWVADRFGWPSDRALALGVVAGAFAAVPDADMVYALTGPLGSDVDGVMEASKAFWGSSTLVHRTVTHSLVVAVPAALAFATLAVPAGHARIRRSTARALGTALAVGLVAVAWVASGWLGGLVMATFVLAGGAVGAVAGRWANLDPAAVFAAALFGLVSHPFGDVLTGEPPAFFYPFDAALVGHRVMLSPDPTLHLLGAFALELAVAWLAMIVYCRLTDRRVRRYVDRTAGLGVAYAAAITLFPPPTLAVSYPFVFSILAVGTVLSGPGLGTTVARWWADLDPEGWFGSLDRTELLRPVATTLAAVTLAWASYLGAYALL